jgi:mediator of RNA polymerase II transcription subunit 16
MLGGRRRRGSLSVTQHLAQTMVFIFLPHDMNVSNKIPTDNTLLLAAYDVASRLHLYRIEATWNIPPQKHGQPAPKHYEKPHLQVSALTIDDECAPTMINNNLNSGAEARVKVPSQLTHLNFLPITPEKGDGSIPTIQAIFSTPPDIVAVNQSQPQQNPFSIIARWEVHQMQQNQLHTSLDKVTSKKKSVGSVPARTVWVLTKQTDTMMHSVVLSFTPLWYHMILGFCYSDGTIEFRKRSTMARIEPDYNSETVTSMAQAGFAFTNVEPSLHIALSPNYCMAACMPQGGTIKLRSMEYTYGSLATDDDEPRHSAALAALILQSTTASNQYFSNDDVFAVMGDLSETRKTQFINLMFEGLNVNIDCGIEDHSGNHLILLGRSPFFVKTLSVIHVLGLQGSVNRSLTSKMAWMILNIKYVTQILTTIARMHGQIEKNPLRPEVVPQFIGICRWIMHFMAYLIDELVETGRSLLPLIAQSPEGLTREILQQHIHDINKPALLILLSSFPRMMLKLWAQPVQWVNRTTFGYINGQPTPEMRRLYGPLHLAITEAPLDWRHFEALISEAQHVVHSIYKHYSGHPDSDAQRNLWERELLLGRIPDVLFPAAKRLVTETLFGDANSNACLVDKVDMAKIMFFDTTWLGFTSSKRANNWFNSHVVDVCQKMVIRGTGAQSHPTNPATAAANQQARNRSDSIQSVNGAAGDDGKKKKPQLRKCVRCGAYMEDVLMGMPGYANHHVSWLMGVAKHCVCGNSWMLAPEKKDAK